MTRKLILAALYVLAVHYAYISYIHPTFAYAHYTYYPPEVINLAITYLLTWLVVLAHRDTAHPSQAAAGLIYVLCYVPIQLSLLFTVEREYFAILPAQMALGLSMTLIFMFAHAGPLALDNISTEFKAIDIGIGIVMIITIVLIALVNRSHMRLVSFEDVYDLRSDSASTPTNAVFNYLASWVSYCFTSYFFARGIIHKKIFYVLMGLISSLVLYMATGAKASLLLLPMTVGLIVIWKSGQKFLNRLLFSLIGLIFFLVFFLPDEGISLWVKSIVLVRILGTSGWSASKYFEYFETNGYTHYTHIGPLNSIFGGYPYGEYSLGQMIGIEYSGSYVANFNASFWASDGFAAAGVYGILIVTFPLILLLYLVNRLSTGLETKFTVAWNTGFFVAMLNVPLTTALLSGGGLIILLLSWNISRRKKKTRNN